MIELKQMWSTSRLDSFLVQAGGAHEATAQAAGYIVNYTECYVVGSAIPGATGQWITWPNEPKFTPPFPQSRDLVGWQYLSGANPGYGSGDHVGGSADTVSVKCSCFMLFSEPSLTTHDTNSGTRVGQQMALSIPLGPMAVCMMTL